MILLVKNYIILSDESRDRLIGQAVGKRLPNETRVIPLSIA